MAGLVAPHGGDSLKPLALSGEALAAELARASTLRSLRISSREKGDLVMLGIGGFTPLEGFMTRADWEGVCGSYRTAAGLFWPIPITLSTDDDSIEAGDEIALTDAESGAPLATMKVSEKYAIDKARECSSVFRTNDAAHPGVAMVMQQPKVNLAGPVKVLSDGGFKAKYGALFMTPAETRAEFERLGWSRVAAFQTRNPMQRAHEHLVKTAIEVCDGVLVHSLLGAVKAGDIPAEVRTRAIAVLIEKYFRPGTVVQAGYPLDMRYAGPREALLHALFRQNYGCSHLIVGRDHAGVGKYYGPFDAHRIFDEIPPGSLQTRPLKMDVTFWCYRCHGMASGRTCPHDAKDQLQVSGTQLRKWLEEGAPVPPEFSRPEVLQVLRAHYA
ncbi:MAG TPA: sulfate adenylyltransferase [Burkholderiales bacterium]|nr:sulfate adenylyltransferase [Burkholderiales bacterium]